MLSYSGKSNTINHRRNEKRKSFTTAFKLEKVLQFKKQCLLSNKFAEFVGVFPSTFQGWVTDHQKELLTSVSVASTEADRKRLRKARTPLLLCISCAEILSSRDDPIMDPSITIMADMATEHTSR